MKSFLKISFLALVLGTQAFADVGESDKKTIVTDDAECKGDIFCVDKMRVTCNARKEMVSGVFDRTVVQTDGDLHREDVRVEAVLRKNGKNNDQNVSDVKRIECLISVASDDRTWLFRDTLSAKLKDTSDCRDQMEKNIQSGKRVLFQEMQEGRSLFLQRYCRVYLLELIKK